MSKKLPKRNVSSLEASAEADDDDGQILDLDTRFDLWAFGSERADQSAPAAAPAQDPASPPAAPPAIENQVQSAPLRSEVPAPPGETPTSFKAPGAPLSSDVAEAPPAAASWPPPLADSAAPDGSSAVPVTALPEDMLPGPAAIAPPEGVPAVPADIARADVMWQPPLGATIALKPAPGADLASGPSILREQPPDAGRLPASAESQRRWTLVAAALILLGAALATAGLLARRPGAVVTSPPTTGELTVDSTPAGASVIISGEDRGRTPVSVRLPPGSYDVELRRGRERHVVAARVNAGATTAQHVVLSSGGAPSTGRLRVTSDPPSASVTVDGEHQGRTPVLVTDLAPGPHEVVVTGPAGQATRRAHVNAAATTLVSVPLSRQASAPAAETVGGSVAVRSPVELQVFEGTRLLGTTRSARLVLPTGPHTLRFANEAAGVNENRRVIIEPGKTTRLDIAVPMGTMSINATPWAIVSIDGREVGETPLGGLEVAAGPHEIVFRHPELGEQRQRIKLPAGITTRLSVDMRR